MVDAVISVVVERVAAIMEDQIRYELNLVGGVEKEVLNLSDKLKTIKNVLDDAEKRGVKEQIVKKWLKKLEDVAYVMDDILDEWNYTLKHKMGKNQSTDPAVASAKQKVCCSFIPSSSCLPFNKVVVRRGTAKKIENVKDSLDQILKEKDDFNFVMSQPSTDVVPNSWRVQSTSSIELGKIHGLNIENNKNDIVTKLMMVNGDIEILSIVGMGGLGKTTLAQLVYNDTRLKGSFDLKFWICVSDPFDVEGIARGVVNSVGRKETIPQRTNQLELVLQKLRDSILGKKFLLVLDDVWTEDYNKWEPLKVNLKDGAAGSKVLVTTRNVMVAKMMGSLDHQIYHPQHLSDEECWTLLRRISLPGRSEGECGVFEELGKKIAEKCKGLPLAANVLGRLLQFKSSLEEWDSVLESQVWRLEKVEVDLFPHLLLSYNELPPALKRCFSYCAVYPKGSEIKVESLIREWMALGYLGSLTGNGGVEDKGREYLNNLAMRSLFRDIRILEEDGSIVGCKMHDIVHDFALFLRGNNGKSPHEVGADMTKSSGHVCNPLLVSGVQEYRSLVWVRHRVSRESPRPFCDCLTTVRVLRFEQPCLDGLPQGMEKLIHLRWLDLSGSKMCKDELEIICKLYFLQTLLLSRCHLKEIPTEIGNLVELRHLDLSDNAELKELPKSVCSLVELRTLVLFFCQNLRALPEGIHTLQNLHHLLIMETPASRHLPRGLGKLSGLRSLDSWIFGGRGCNKLGLLKKLNGLSGSLYLEINITSTSDLEELVEDAREAELRSKTCIHKLSIEFKKDEVEQSSSSLSLWMGVMEALEPNQKLNELWIEGYGGSGLPQWISSPLSRVKVIFLYDLDELSSLPPLGKLPLLEILTMDGMKELKCVGRELLGIDSPSSSSSTSTKKEVVAFPKLKKLRIKNFPECLEWEDITAEEEESSLVSILPCFEKLSIKSCEGLKKLPHRLLGKASSTLRVLKIVDSSVLQSQYGGEDGSQWRSISQNCPKLEYTHVKGRYQF